MWQFCGEKKIHALHGQLMSQVGTTSCQTVQLIISQHSRHYSGYEPRPRHSKHIIQKNIMIQAMPLSQQRRNLSFLIRHSGVNARRLWWADFVVPRTKTGWLFAAWISGSATRCSFSFDTQTRGRYRAFYLSARESRGKKVHFTKFGLLCQLFGSSNDLRGSFVE